MQNIDLLSNDIELVYNEVDEYASLYAKLEYMAGSIEEYGISSSLYKAFNYNNELKEILPNISMESLTVGDSTDCTIIALEDLKNIFQKFWEWIKQACASIADMLTRIYQSVMNVFAKTEQLLSKQAVSLNGMSIDENKFNTVTANLIPYERHMIMMKALPSLNSEVHTFAGSVMAIDWTQLLKSTAKFAGIAIGGTILSAGAIAAMSAFAAPTAAAVTGTAKTAAIMGASNVGIAKAAGTAGMAAAKGSMSAAALAKLPMAALTGAKAVSFKKLAGAGFKTWQKLGAKVTPNGAIDMTGYLHHKAFKPFKNTLKAHGWDKNKATDIKELLAVTALVKKMQITINDLKKSSGELERQISPLYKQGGNMHPKLAAAARIGAKFKLENINNSQRLIGTLVKTVNLLCKNMLRAQQAVASCKVNTSVVVTESLSIDTVIAHTDQFEHNVSEYDRFCTTLEVSDDTNNEVSLESLNSTIVKFWEWLKKMCTQISELIQKLSISAVGLIKGYDKILISHSNKIKNSSYMDNRLKITPVKLISYDNHLSMMKLIPKLQEDMEAITDKVVRYQWYDMLFRVANIPGLRGGGTVKFDSLSRASDAVDKDLVSYIVKLKEFSIGALRPVATNAALSIGGVMIGSSMKALFIEKDMLNWSKCGAKFNKDASVDLSGVDKYKPLQISNDKLGKLGWNVKTTSDLNEILKLVERSEDIRILMNEVDFEMKSYNRTMELYSKDLLEGLPPTHQSIVKDFVKVKIDSGITLNKLYAKLLMIINKLLQNFVLAQKAVLSCTI